MFINKTSKKTKINVYKAGYKPNFGWQSRTITDKMVCNTSSRNEASQKSEKSN